MTSNDASLRGAPSLLVLVRAAVEGEAVETMPEMQARVRSESSSGEGSAGTSGSGASGERVDRPFEPFGLGAEGQAQAASLGVELASVLAGFGVAKATMAFPKSSRPGEETAAEIAARLSGVSPEETQVSVETRVSSSSLASPEDGDYPRQTAALESFARASRPPPGEALVCVSNDTRLLREAAQCGPHLGQPRAARVAVARREPAVRQRTDAAVAAVQERHRLVRHQKGRAALPLEVLPPADAERRRLLLQPREPVLRGRAHVRHAPICTATAAAVATLAALAAPAALASQPTACAASHHRHRRD